MILAKNHWETQDSIDKLFEKSEALEINNQLRTLQKRTFETSLSNVFEGSLNLI